MRPPRPQPRSGIALIIVMIAVFVLSMLVGAFAYAMKVETTLARNARNDSELIWLGRSGVEMARYAVALQLTITAEDCDAPHQVWAGGRGGLRHPTALSRPCPWKMCGWATARSGR